MENETISSKHREKCIKVLAQLLVKMDSKYTLKSEENVEKMG